VHRHPDGPHELYDLANDPDERDNRIDAPASAAMLAALRARLETWFARYVDPLRDGLDKGITGCGQLGRIPASGVATGLFAADPIAPLQVPARSS
jgi:choline-sulfatase